MQIKDIPEGQIFTIGETPSYPKLKLKSGYIDMRDRIIVEEQNMTEAAARMMWLGEIAKGFDVTIDMAVAWINECNVDAKRQLDSGNFKK